ncbi:MAG TPA: hypothetical protein VKV95_09790 [Terriglobia bacterium]|nr:hypothetical protein [Terriglobia bacterium]
MKAQTATESINASQLPHVLSSISVHRTKENENIWWDENENQQAVVDLDGLILRSIQHTGRTFMPLRREAQDAIRSLLGGLTYLQPTRMRPSRSYKNDIGAWQRIGYAGEGTPALLQQEGDKPISFPDPAPIPHSMEQAKAVLGKNWEARDSTLLGAVNVWLEKLGLASSVRPKYFEQDRRNLQISVSLPGQEPHDITEIGFGVSQVIPVLTAGLMQSEGSLFIVDLPEAHLHPWPQARLADFFCSLALSGRSSLIETHSEMFFHQLRLRAEMYPALNKEIAVYFVDEPKDGECSPPRAIGLSSKGQLRWPAGFLAEAWDTEKHIKFIREARGGER